MDARPRGCCQGRAVKSTEGRPPAQQHPALAFQVEGLLVEVVGVTIRVDLVGVVRLLEGLGARAMFPEGCQQFSVGHLLGGGE